MPEGGGLRVARAGWLAGLLAIAWGVVPVGAAAQGADPGCDSRRSAVAHYAGAATAPSPPDPPSPCLYEVGFPAAEPTLGITQSGAILFQGTGDPDEVIPRVTGLVIRSTDGGATWRDVSPRLPTGHHSHLQTFDPYLYVDRLTSRVFTADFATWDPDPVGVYPGNCSQLSFSDDAGEHWQETLVGCLENDHQTVFAGPPTVSRPRGYPNVVYYCAIATRIDFVRFGHATFCEKSLDGGRLFLPTGAPTYSDVDRATDREAETDYGLPAHCGGPTGHGVVGPDGTVYLPRGWCGQPWLAISRDEGRTWRRVQVADNGLALTDFGLRDHDGMVAADAQGNVFYVWIARDRLPYLAVSRDRGRTWGEPMMIAAPGIREASLVNIVEEPHDGRLAFVYMGSTNSPGPPYEERANCLTAEVACLKNGLDFMNYVLQPGYEHVSFDGYMAVTDDPLSEAPLFLSATVNDPDDPLIRGDCGPTRCREEFDFLDVVFDSSGDPWASLVDGCRGACVHGEAQDGLHDDVVGVVGRLGFAASGSPE